MLAGPLSEAIGASGPLYGAGVLMTLAAITTFASRSVRQLPAEVTASAAPARASLRNHRHPSPQFLAEPGVKLPVRPQNRHLRPLLVYRPAIAGVRHARATRQGASGQ